MKVTRAAMYSAGLGSLVAWWAAASTSTPQAGRDVSSLQEAAGRTETATVADEVSRLRDWRSRAQPPQRPSRNLFRFATPPPAPEPEGTGPAPISFDPVPQAFPTVAPLTLIGMAEDSGPDGIVRTAIISGAAGLFLVQEGDEVGARFRVSKISDDVVDLAGTDGTFLRLTLK